MRDIWRIIRFTKSLWPYYTVISIFTILLAVLSQLIPIFTKFAVDEIGKAGTPEGASIMLVATFAGAIFLADLASTIVSNIGGYYGDIMSIKIKQLLSHRYYEHMLSLPQKYFDTELTGKIINRMSRGITQISEFVQVVSNNFLQFLVSTILSLFIVALYSWPVALMLLALYPIFIVLTTRTSGKWLKYQTTINKAQDIASGRFAESIGQVRVVKSFIQETRELSFFGARYKKMVATTRPQSKLWHTQDILRRSVLNVIFFGVFAYIFIATAQGQYSLGTMVLLIQFAMFIRLPIFTISFLVDQTQRAVGNARDYFEAMDVKSDIKDLPDAVELKIEKGEITFTGVHFAYDSNKPVLKGISFKVDANSKIALVGESGEGKTTIANLLMRLYEPQKGAILLDDIDIATVTQNSLRGNIGVVFQDPSLFSGTVLENITYANPDASLARVKEVAKAANADEFIAKLPKGYDTEIGERGVRLSGGQKQRIAIARALLKDAPILILDEATSSLDSKAEHQVQEALERLMHGRTTLIIAHRLSTIAHVDQIVTISGGEVDEVGSPAKLARTGGIYAQLLDLQLGATEAAKKKLKEFDIAAN
jgi:ATP-binding cassette subfamily B protein